MDAQHLDLLSGALLLCIGIVIGIVLDHFILPAIVDVYVGRLRRDGG